MAEFRKESDLIGELNVPVDALYGVQSLRGFNNFKISGVPMNAYPNFIKGLLLPNMVQLLLIMLKENLQTSNSKQWFKHAKK